MSVVVVASAVVVAVVCMLAEGVLVRLEWEAVGNIQLQT